MFTQKGSFIMKKSRTFRKSFVAAIAALCLAAPLAVMPMTVSADTTINVTPTDKADHIYKAYQVFSGTYADGVLGQIEWGSGINTSADGFSTDMQNFTGLTGDVKASDVAGKLTQDNAKDFAAIIAKYASGTSITLNASGTTSTGEKTYNGTVSDGYYLIKDESESLSEASYTAYVLEVAGEATISVTAKTSIPTIVKKVKENTDVSDYTDAKGVTHENYNDVADYNIGDKVPFIDIGTLPSNLDNYYDEYFYQIIDKLDPEFDVTHGENGAHDIVVKVDGKEVNTDDYTLTVEEDTGGTTITVTFKDINDIDDKDDSDISVTGSSIVTVEYTAELKNNADIGQDNGQTSEVYLKFSNDPNEDYTPSTSGPSKQGETPKDRVIVFTYELDITKTFQQSDGSYVNAVAGNAKFKIKNKDGKYATVADNKITGWDDNGTEVDTDVSGLVKFKGLDAGAYTIVETDTLAGYNKILDKDIVIAATMITDRQAWTSNNANEALTALTIDGTTATNLSEGIVGLEIQNNRGSSLPSTGGIGTTIFYLGGGTMAAVAGVYLITKKRMKNEEDDEI